VRNEGNGVRCVSTLTGAEYPLPSLQGADLLFRKGQFYARFRYWGAPLREMSEAEVLAFLLPLAENVCGRMT